MSRALRIVERARADADAIFEWLAPRSVQGAISWYLAFRRTITRIADTPVSFPVAEEADRLARPIRQALFKTRRGRTYRIVFEVSDAEITILRVRGPGQAPMRPRDV